MYWNIGHMSWMWASWILGFIFLGLLVWWVAAASRQSRDSESPEEILKRRYARGEIEREDYLKRLDELRR